MAHLRMNVAATTCPTTALKRSLGWKASLSTLTKEARLHSSNLPGVKKKYIFVKKIV